MTDAVALALITGGFGTITATITAVGAVISRKARDAARDAARRVDEVRAQAEENGAMSKANHITLTKVVEQTDGNVRKLQEMWAEEARRRESEAWAAAFEAGRLAEMTKNRRKTDALPRPETANDEEAERMRGHMEPPEVLIAAMVHEANRQYCAMFGNDDSQPAWDAAPAWQRESAINGVRWILDGSISSPRESHESWMREKLAAGWKYGERKDPEAKTHPCLVPYDQLDAYQRKKDDLFRAIVLALKD